MVESTQKYSLLFSGASLLFNPDAWSVSQREWKLPYLQSQITMHYPGMMFQSIFLLGFGTAMYYVGKGIACLSNRLRTYFKSLSNGSKYLQANTKEISEGAGQKRSYTAVIYGAGTKVGRIYAHFLAEKGFNLIIVERDAASLNNLEVTLNTNLIQEPLITKIVLDKFQFDMDTFNKQVLTKLKAHKNSPIKIFINCKNSRRKLTSEQIHTQKHLEQLQASLGDSLLLDQSVLNDDDRYTLQQLWEPAITREEIFFAGKENIEGMCVLLSHFLPQMISKEVENPCLINIDNHDFEAEEDMESVQPGALFYDSVIKFKDTFTELLPQHVRNKVQSITLKTDFNNIPPSPTDDRVQTQICQQVFDFMGLKKMIHARFPKLTKPESQANTGAQQQTTDKQ